MTETPEISAKTEEFRSPLAPRTSFADAFFSFRAEKKYLLLCFIVPFAIMGLMYICMSYYHGDECVLVLDLNGQYVYFFEALNRFIRGDASLLYSFSRALGGEFIGIFAYYISSPLSLIAALLPKAWMTESILAIMLLKTGACGLTFGIYLEATRRERNRTATVLFSTMYALCGYCVVMQHNTMWFDNVLLLPLIMLGIENLIKFGKFRLYVITLILAIFSNFYIGYMTCIFSAVYFVYYYFSCTPEERNPMGVKNHGAKALGRMALYSVISVAVCAALLFATYYSLTLGKTDFSHPNYAPEQKFDWLDLLPKFFIGSYDTVRPEGLPFVYSGTLTLILFPLYFFAPHVKVREKIASGVLIAFFLLSFNTTTADLMWHGLQKPNWLNCRYSYMLCFFLILFAYKAFERLREIGYRKAICVSGILALLLIIMQKQGYENLGTYTTVWLSLAIIGIYLCVLWAVCSDSKEKAAGASLVLAVLVGTEMFGGGLLNMSSLDDDVRYSVSGGYREFIDGLRPVTEEILSADTSFYRMEKTHHRKTNDNMALSIRGLSNSTSTLNSETIAFLHDFGLSSKSHWSKYLGGTPVEDSLFGIKYLIAEHDTDEIFETYKETDFGSYHYTVWENPNAMSLAAAVSPDLKDLDTHDEIYSPFERMNRVVSAMLGIEHGVKIFSHAVYGADVDPGDMQVSSVSNHTKYQKTDSGYQRVTYTVKITSDDVLYCYFPSEYMRECYLFVDGKKHGTVFGNETDRIIELGSFEAGEYVEIALEPMDDHVYIMDDVNYFYYLNEEEYEKYMPQLLEDQYEIEEYTDDHFKGKINVSEGHELVYTSIPYDEGWNITVDGEKVSPVKLLNGVIGFDIAPGEHTLEMRYFPNALKYGLIVQAAGIVALAAVWIFTEKRRKKLLAAGCPVWEEALDVLPDESAFEETVGENEPIGDVDEYFAPQQIEITDTPDNPEEITDIEENENSGEIL